MSNAQIIPVPIAMLPEMWRHAAPHLLKGLTKATDTTLKQLVDDLIEGTDQLWVVIQDKAVIAAFVSAQFIDESTGKPFEGFYGLGGSGLPDFAEQLSEVMVERARITGADSARFTGRDAWSRVLPAYRIIGRHDNGEAIYERAVQ